jgi:hypothetical protein
MKLYKSIILLILSCNHAWCQFTDLNLGTNGRINTLFHDTISNVLFVGGIFNLAGNQNINNIASWDGANWSSFGSNEKFINPGSIECITNFNGNIVVGGLFDSIGQTPMNNISMWNGTSWVQLGAGFNSTVISLKVYNNELYAGGLFGSSGTQIIRGLAKWTGSQWIEITSLMGYVATLEIFDNKLIVGGNFYHMNISAVANIMAWDGANVDTTYNGFNNLVIKLKTIEDTLYAVGRFTLSVNNGKYASAYYNNTWNPIGNPPVISGSGIGDICKYENKLFFAGGFQNNTDFSFFNGNSFDSVASLNGYIISMCNYDSGIVVAGLFNMINNQPFNFISKYKTTNTIINNLTNTSNFSVSPNPTTDISFLRCNMSGLNKHRAILVDFNGNLIYEKYILEGSQIIDSSLHPGIYCLRIFTDNSSYKSINLIKVQ